MGMGPFQFGRAEGKLRTEVPKSSTRSSFRQGGILCQVLNMVQCVFDNKIFTLDLAPASQIVCMETKKKSILVLSFVDLLQNTTIEERVSLLEIQVVEIQEDITGLGVDLTELDENVDFLFDEQIIQDEKLLNLEQETEEIDEQLVVIGDELDIVDDALQSKIVKLTFVSRRFLTW